MIIFISLCIYSFTIFKLCLSQKTKFQFSLTNADHMCLFENFPEKQMVIFSIQTKTLKDFKIDLKNSKGKVLITKLNENFNEGFMTNTTEYLEICVYNFGTETKEFDFELKYGVSANDFSSVIKEKDLKPIDAEMRKLIDKKSFLDHYSLSAQNNDVLFEQILDSMSHRIVFYSACLIVLMISIGFMEIIYLKKFMERRKII